MSLLGDMGNTAGKAISGIGKVFIPKKKVKTPEQKNFIHESPEEYAQRLMKRRSMRH